MNLLGEIHVVVAIYSVIAGALVLRNRKGTVLHTWLGRSFVAAMVITDLSSFGLLPKYGVTWFHALAIVFGVGAVLIERTGKCLRVRSALHASDSVA